MSMNVYEIACQHASGEIAEIDSQIDRLTHRKELIGKLLALFEQLDEQFAPIDSSVMISEVRAPAVLAPEVAEHQLPESEAVVQGSPD